MAGREPATITKDFQRTTLAPRHRRVVRALAEAMFSPDDEVDAARLDDLVDDVDDFISPASKTLRFGLVLILDVIRWSPLLFLRPRPFEALTVEERTAHLERLERSRVKQLPLLVVAYKTMLTMLFYEDPAEQQKTLRYPGSHRERWRREEAATGARSLPIAAEEGSGGATREASP